MILSIILFLLMVGSAAATEDPALRNRRLGICGIILVMTVVIRLLLR